jgi:hypothetical protein
MKLDNYISIYEDALARYYNRKGLAAPEKLSIYDKLEKYSKDYEIHISFRDIVKSGLSFNNPTIAESNTPIGFYCYPLKDIWKKFSHSTRTISVPYVGDKPYVYVVKPKSSVRTLYLSSMDEQDFEYWLSELYDGMRRVFKYYSDNDAESVIDFAKDQVGKDDSYGRMFWWYTEWIAKDVNQSSYYIVWNKIFDKALKVGLVIDTGNGIIHDNEPCQSFFLSSNDFEVIDVLENKYPSNTKIKYQWQPIEDMKDFKFYHDVVKYIKEYSNLTKMPWRLPTPLEVKNSINSKESDFDKVSSETHYYWTSNSATLRGRYVNEVYTEFVSDKGESEKKVTVGNFKSSNEISSSTNPFYARLII